VSLYDDPTNHVPCVGCGDDGWQRIGSEWIQCGCPIGRRQVEEIAEDEAADGPFPLTGVAS